MKTEQAEQAGQADLSVVDLDAQAAFEGAEYTFKRPFKLHGKIHRAVAVRAPTGRDTREVFQGRASAQEFALMVERLTGLDAATLDAMHAADRTGIENMVGKLLG